jgi:hypothetical protein
VLSHHRTTLVVGALLAVLAFHLAVAWQDFGTLARNGFLYDDGFYAFKIAENIAHGEGPTFDGVHPTTGFQPLYVLLLVPIYALSGDNLGMPVYAALSMLALFTCLTAFLLYRICLRYAGWGASLAAALIWAFSPVVTRQAANGLETALASLMIAASVLYYLERVRPVENPGGGRFMALGLLLGITILSRIDGLILLLVLLLDYLVVLRARRAPARRLAQVSLIGIGVALLYGPWLVFNMAVCGSPLQDSGSATRFLSLAYAGYFGYGTGDMGVRGPDPSFIWAHVTHAISTLKVVPPLHVIFRAMDRAGAILGLRRGFHAAGDVFGFLALAAFAVAAVRWRLKEGERGRGELHFLLLFAAALLSAYATYVFGMFFFMRYFYPIYLIACLYVAPLFDDAYRWLARRSAGVRRAFGLAAVVYAGLFGCFSYSQAFRSRPIYPFYDIARWVSENTGAAEKIGVFQCGMIGYLSHRDIVNLDGKVNRDALHAMKNGTLDEYLRAEGIDVVIDHAEIIRIFLGDPGGDMRARCAKVPCMLKNRPTGWVAYRTEVDPVRSATEARDVGGATERGNLSSSGAGRSTKAFVID